MKNIFILGLLIIPIMANATPTTDSSGNPAMASDYAPYQTATEEPGDTTNVVSASYVKGAYNDAIAAINWLNLKIDDGDTQVHDELLNHINSVINSVETGLAEYINTQRVSAVTTWGNDTPTKLTLTTASN